MSDKTKLAVLKECEQAMIKELRDFFSGSTSTRIKTLNDLLVDFIDSRKAFENKGHVPDVVAHITDLVNFISKMQEEISFYEEHCINNQ